ncbi:alpha-amylase family glycosyl hydrolase [Flavobacterium sp.]|jgi:glycosidase|uniref:alpha-amylase family glycosyl hydrolase n=1 Tax=Flavobacterium sp. TaxID=239 RepID=UPI0037BF7A53
MRNIYFILLLFISSNTFSQVSWQGGITPEANQSGTILFDKTGTGLASYTGTIYAHTGVTLNGAPWQNVISNWGNTSQPTLTLVSGNIYKLDLIPTLQNFYSVTSGTISKINIVLRSASGTMQTTDLELNVGAYQVNLTAPIENSTTLLNSGQSIVITANNTNGNANYNLLSNGISINSSIGTNYSYTDVNITENKNYELQITQNGTTYNKRFSAIINPGILSQALPNGLEIGINYNTADATKAILVLEAPGKDYVYVAGSFNNWQPTSSYAMKKDPTNGKFWLELNNLTSGTEYLYQYWVVDTTPIANSPSIVKTADPCSTLVLSSYDDPWIPAGSYPNIPSYPNGQNREITVLQTGQNTYNWQNTSFTKPNKDKLVIYELLIRDFDTDRNYQDLIDKVDYFKNLGITAIELMPVMEFEGNESWGYNTAFHMALDKFYGTKNKFKEFIDLCHQNGIAVILDIAFNHAFGRNPMIRMWMNDPDGDGWGSPSTENPYFNTVAKHSYSVGEDFNHASNFTKEYVKKTIKHWITEFKIDGFRWDLTKGFTQNCTASDQSCTNNYQADRVAILKDYADYTWNLDADFYNIFEHLGSDLEEQQWANYRLSEGKGIMMWGELYEPYKQLTSGYAINGDINRMGHVSRGFTGKRLIGYSESHDKDRLMYQAFAFGNGAGTAPVNGNLNNTLNRMSTVGATSLLIPGPKMIWHFQELGMDDSIYACENGTVNSESDATPGDCKLATKQQPQWLENWLTTSPRSTIYSDYAKFIKMKKNDPVFNGDYSISINGNNTKQRIYIYDNSLPATQLKNVVVLANYSVAAQSITADFPYTGTWYNLMDTTTTNVTATNMQITLGPGEFKIFGNQLSTALSNESFETISKVELYPNPSTNAFQISVDAKKVEIYSLTGQLIQTENNCGANKEINISNLAKGIYIVKITNSDAISLNKKLIKE